MTQIENVNPKFGIDVLRLGTFTLSKLAHINQQNIITQQDMFVTPVPAKNGVWEVSTLQVNVNLKGENAEPAGILLITVDNPVTNIDDERFSLQQGQFDFEIADEQPYEIVDFAVNFAPGIDNRTPVHIEDHLNFNQVQTERAGKHLRFYLSIDNATPRGTCNLKVTFIYKKT